MSGPSSIIKKNISSIITLLIGILVFINIPNQIDIGSETSINSVNSRTLPYLIASAIIVLSLLIIISDIIISRKKEAAFYVNKQIEDSNYIRVFLSFICIMLWIVLIPYIGFNIATILLISAIMLIIGNRNWWQIIILSLILSLPLNYLLKVVLRVYLPQGLIFQ